MTIAPFRKVPLAWLVTLALVCLAPVFAVSTAGAQETGPRLEYYDDPPARAVARPPLGAAATAPVTLSPYTSVQVNVSEGGANIPGDAANEPSIAVDPDNPNSIVIGWRHFDNVVSNFREAGYAYSRDGGRTWTFPGVLEDGVFRSDPVLAPDASGTLFYNSLSYQGGGPTGTYRCDVFRSTDGGQTWAPPIYAYGGDKAWMAIDRTSGIGNGHIYSAWNIFSNPHGSNTFTRSTDGGATYAPPTFIPFQPMFGTMDVGPDGTLWVAGVLPTNPWSGFPFKVAKSMNAKDAAAAPTFTTSEIAMAGTLCYNNTAGPNPVGLCGQVGIAVDHTSGPTAANIYVLSSVDPASPDPLDIHFIRSSDGGQNWSAPLRVNDDVGNNWNWFGTLSVAPSGRIDVVWNDNRNGGGDPFLTESYYSFSTDGGNTWSPSALLTPQWRSDLGWPNQQKIGDYYHMISDEVGAHLAYAATFNGEQDVWYVRIGDYDCNANGVSDLEDIDLGSSLDANGNEIPDECEATIVPSASTWGRASLLVWVSSSALFLLRRSRIARKAEIGA